MAMSKVFNTERSFSKATTQHPNDVVVEQFVSVKKPFFKKEVRTVTINHYHEGRLVWVETYKNGKRIYNGKP